MMKIASVVLLFFLNPNCDSFISWLVSAQYDILSLSIAVKNLAHYWEYSYTSIIAWDFLVALLMDRFQQTHAPRVREVALVE